MAKAIAPTSRTALKDDTTLPRWQTPTRLRPMLATDANTQPQAQPARHPSAGARIARRIPRRLHRARL